VTAISVSSAHRLASVDPLLPAQTPPEQAFSGLSADPFACEARFAVTGASGQPIAVARCAHWTGAPGSLDLIWGASRRFTLLPEIAGPDLAGALSQLIEQWQDHLASVPWAGAEDTAAVINWPSRDIDGLNVMLAHGLTPLNIVAAKRLRPKRLRPKRLRPGPLRPGPLRPGPPATTQQAQPGGLRINRATPADLDVLAGLATAEIGYDAHFGGVIERPHTGAAMRTYLADLLSDPQPWVWVAERAGTIIGLLAAEPPSTATWIAPLTSLSPVAYLMSAYVDAAERGSGIGRALTDEFHRAAEDEGVGVVLLHYELFNPRSGPFWSQQGYRPLWTALEARPARRLIGHSI
jgi:GNAT superfamily N-acetyltransferase